MKSVKTFVIAVLYGVLTAFCVLACCAEAHADELQGKCIVIQPKVKEVKEDKAKEPEFIGYTIKIDDKEYKIYRGPKGGLFYVVNGKKRYLTKEQKELIK